MRSKDLLALAWGNLLRRRTRTILAIIGVVIGTCAIVVMVSIGFGLTASFESQIASFGNLHTIEVYNWGGGGMVNGQQIKLDDKNIEKLGKIDGVTAITPLVDQYLNFKVGKLVGGISVYGIDPKVMDKLGYEIDQGRMLNSSDEFAIVFGRDVINWFRDPRDTTWREQAIEPVTKDIIISGDWNLGTKDEGSGDIKYEYFDAEGVGLLANENDESSYRAYMPIKTVQAIQKSIQKSEGYNASTTQKPEYNQALIYVEDIDLIPGICEIIKEDYGFSTYSLNDVLAQMRETTAIIELVLGGIGAISLLVAAIGIANTMTMSVYERTREIGVMKVIGASLKDIGNMFITEAGMIGFIGGAIGLIISYALSILMNTVLLPVMQSIIGGGEGTVVSVIPIWLSVAAVAFTSAVGMLSGYFPARRAMNLSALESLKND